MLNSDYIYQQIPVEIRPFFKIEMGEIPVEHANLLDNIAHAIRTISHFAHLNKTVNVFVGSFPLEVLTPNSVLSVRILEPALHIALENFVFLDLDKLVAVYEPIQRACALEELAHSLMNVKDE